MLLLSGRPPAAQTRHRQAITAASLPALRQWDAATATMPRSGDLRVRNTHDDTLVAGHAVERDDQYYRGVRLFISRQTDPEPGESRAPDPRRLPAVLHAVP